MRSDQASERKLKPTLGLFDAVAISVGAIVGAGIFVVTGIAAGYAGSALVISMVVAAVIASFTAVSFAELTAWLPKEGSVYEFGCQLISPLWGFLGGWMWIVSNTFSGAAVSLGFAYYFTNFFPMLLPQYVAAILCLVFTAINFFGMRQSARVNNLLVTGKLIILAFFCVFGLFHFQVGNFTPFLPFQAGVFQGAFFIFFAFGGFGRVAVVAEEVKNPKRNVPRAILLSLLISTMIYVVVGLVAVGLVGAGQLSSSNSPLAQAVGATGSALAVNIVSAGGMLATASVLLTSVLGVSRMIYSMARRRDLPEWLSRLHGKLNTPFYAVWITGFAMALLVLFTDLSSVVSVSTFSMLFYYGLANVSALRLPRESRLYSSVIPVLGVVSCLLLLLLFLFVSTFTWIFGLAILTVGIGYYFSRKRLNSRRQARASKW